MGPQNSIAVDKFDRYDNMSGIISGDHRIISKVQRLADYSIHKATYKYVGKYLL